MMAVSSPMVKSVIILTTYGILEIGDTPRSDLAERATPLAMTKRPKVSNI